MGLISKDLMELTGLEEQVIKERLVKKVKADSRYEGYRTQYDAGELADTYPDDSWGFILLVLGNDLKQLAKLAKGRSN